MEGIILVYTLDISEEMHRKLLASLFLGGNSYFSVLPIT